MIGRLTKEGVQVHVERCGASHSPFLSMPQRVGDLVDEVGKASSNP
jgi:hypothetical protein